MLLISNHIENDIKNPDLKEFGVTTVLRYTIYQARLGFLNLKYIDFRKTLYHSKFLDSNYRKIIDPKLKLECYRLDAMTGEYIKNPVAHHITYDKSEYKFKKLILLDDGTNQHIIRDPPLQRYFGEPIDFSNSPTALKQMNILLKAKDSYSKGAHPKNWENFKDFRSIKWFYWNQYNVKTHKLKEKWLDTPAAANGPPARIPQRVIIFYKNQNRDEVVKYLV